MNVHRLRWLGHVLRMPKHRLPRRAMLSGIGDGWKKVRDTVGKVDIIATVSGDGSSSLANALRLAIARCLASMLPIDQGKNRLLVTGLLSQDNRFAERKQPGQRKARKKPIW
ncbi:unnamed protein product [Schistosoma mattheei]|uniref:Uncharacterized protein n=1 Tax=Schistosoma mattheei TaxID=31246 RepID=A0A183P5G8_9TREM|nr:unnamed protein product [Schistosoma mattheei]